MTKVVLIANPASGRGRGARLIPQARAAFVQQGFTDVRLTQASGDEARLVRAALDDGATTIAVLGGDGTWSKCAAALADSRADCRMTFLHAGTGNDFAKNFPAPARDFSAMARLIAGPCDEWRVDMGRVESANGGDWFLNVAGFGFDAAVLESTMRGGALKGNAVYIAAALQQLLGYRGVDVAISSPDAASNGEASSRDLRRAMMLVFSNGRNFGGAFRIAPDALVTDGLLDLVRIGDVRGLARLPLFLRAIRGAHVSHREVAVQRSHSFSLVFIAPPAFEVDGELLRAPSREVTVRSVPGVLRVVAGPEL